MKKETPKEWGKAQQTAFDLLKKKLTEELILTHLDFRKQFYLFTDASNEGLGAVLMQKDDQGRFQIIACDCKILSPTEQNYPVTEKECYAVKWAMLKFKHFLGGGQPFVVYTDHTVLKTMMTHDYPSHRRARWMEAMAPFNFTVEYRPGRNMQAADYMSRINQFQDQQGPVQFKDRLRKRSPDQNTTNNIRLYTYPHWSILIN